MTSGHRDGVSLAYAAILLIALAMLLAPASSGHVDDLDAQLHRVIVKNMVARGDWLDLSIVPGYGAHFRDHLPFAFWAPAALTAVFGPRSMELIEVFFSLGTVAVVLFAGRRLLGPGAGLAAALVLSLTEAFWHWGGRVLPDPFLWLCATASAVLVLDKEVSIARWLVASLLAAAAAMVKGPFGLAPLACAATASAVIDKSPRKLFIGASMTLLATIPVAGFLFVDARWLHLGWWEGYGRDQLFASALGLRKDGAGGGRFYPFWITLHRFWPGFPLLIPAAFAAFSSDRKRIVRAIWCWCLLLLFVLCLPARKWGTHTVVAFPALALLAGAGAGRFLEFWPAHQPASQRLSIGMAVLAITLLTADAFGLGRLVQRPPCAVATTLGKYWSPYRKGLTCS
jgi:4-amino-4-deoxy-L-arabinose transferase-like glycosyltransferase